MKLTNVKNAKRGMTLLELTVVILVLLSLISILFVGVRAWKQGADRSQSIMTIRNAQQAIRGIQNMQAANPGDTVAALDTQVFGNTGAEYINTGLAPGTVPTHPATGVTFGFHAGGATVLPAVSTTYITSDDAAYNPTDTTGW
ncbi:MAG: prepilin-type N-terminal cleavage/methylation domain-containing protein [Verrucomicrobiota bacterium]